jgi:hypothetical protein
MKLTSKLALVLLIGIGLSYTACKKNSSSPAPTAKTSNEQVASGQIAQNLAQSLAGAYGGASINDGITAPALASQVADFLLTQLLMLNSIVATPLKLLLPATWSSISNVTLLPGCQPAILFLIR